MEAAAYFEAKGLIPLVLPDYYLRDFDLKDISDLTKKFGIDGLKQFLKGKNLI